MSKFRIPIAIVALCMVVSACTASLLCYSDEDCQPFQTCHMKSMTCQAVQRYEATRRFMRRVIDGRIVGGKSIMITHVPWQVSLTDNFGYHVCGGAIVSKWFIITAAHCINAKTARSIKIRTGTSINGHGGTLTKIARIQSHEMYGASALFPADYDIALIQLKEPLKFAKGVDAIRLADEYDSLADGDPVYVSGWGQLSEKGPNAGDLQTVMVPVINIHVCNSSYSGEVSNRMFCAGYPEGGKDACQGDSGGPAMVNGKLFGIVSWGDGCARGGTPGVYTRISAMREWWDRNAIIK